MKKQHTNNPLLEPQASPKQHICVKAITDHANPRRFPCLCNRTAQLRAWLPAARITIATTSKLNKPDLASTSWNQHAAVRYR